jgi:hypothetical protein
MKNLISPQCFANISITTVCNVLFILGSITSFAQNGITINSNITPGGKFDNVFDSKGNLLPISEIKHKANKILSNGTASTTDLIEDAGYFRLYFENGSGMETVTDPTQNTINTQRRTVLKQVFQDLSNFINSPLASNGLGNKVNIWVRNSTNMPNTTSASDATPFYCIPALYNNYLNYGGVVDNEIWKTIHLGVDSYTNVAPGIVSLITSNPLQANSLT